MLNTPDNSPRPRGKKLESKSSSSNKVLCGSSSDVHSDSGSVGNACQSPCKDKTALIGTKSAAGGSGGFMTLGHKTKLKHFWGKVNQIARGKPGYVIGMTFLSTGAGCLELRHENSFLSPKQGNGRRRGHVRLHHGLGGIECRPIGSRWFFRFGRQ